MFHKRILSAFCIAGLLAPFAVAGDAELSDPKEILRRSRLAIERTDTVAYDVNIEAEGWIRRFISNTQGKAIVGPVAEYGIPRFYCEVELQKNDSEETNRYIAGCDGDDYFLIDPATKKAHKDLDPVVLGSNSRHIQRVVLSEFTAEEPFKDELEAERIEFRGTTEVAGETCYEVVVSKEGASPKSTAWWISVKDFLPRRNVRVFANRQDDGEDGVVSLTLSNVVIDPKFEKSPFKLVVPEGFTKTDEFAP